MSERIEAIRAYHECRRLDDLHAAQIAVANAYHSLSPEECGALLRIALETRNSTILSHLACLQPGSLDGHHLKLAEEAFFKHPFIFHRADSEATTVLIQRLESGNANADLYLLALAWADNPMVVDAFCRWRSALPSWSRSLFIPPHEYADSAGWELTENGERRGLILEECYPLIPPDHEDAVQAVVGINAPSDSSCGWCNRRMTALFDLDLTSGMLAFLGIAGSRLRIVTCDVCTCCGFVFTQVDWDGGASWHPANVRPDYLPEDVHDWPMPTENPLFLSGRPRPGMESADRNMPISFSQVGGYPSWEQDAEYPRCPTCEKKMIFIAQLSNGDFQKYGEGIYYAFLCNDCQVAATHYQQT